jgi:hypothetical protein
MSRPNEDGEGLRLSSVALAVTVLLVMAAGVTVWPVLRSHLLVAGPAPAPSPSPASARWTAYSGPRCSSAGAAPLLLTDAGGTAPPWHGGSASARGFGCTTPSYSHQSGSRDAWRNVGHWVFLPGRGVTTCSLAVHVPPGTWAGDVRYNLYAGDTTAGFYGAAFATFHLDQHVLDAGGWATEGPYRVSTGTLDVEITDAGTDPHYGAVADVVTATCS